MKKTPVFFEKSLQQQLTNATKKLCEKFPGINPSEKLYLTNPHPNFENNRLTMKDVTDFFGKKASSEDMAKNARISDINIKNPGY